ncbi:MAG: ribosomal protein [Francisellaceae bacterium]|nr:ribosomal protein [Francisellaceae bacterium]
MYAVIKSGGQQHRVIEGESLKLMKIDGEPDTEIEFNEVLMLGQDENIQIGTPLLAGCKVLGVIKAQGKYDKIRIIKIKRRKNHRKQMGHRQDYTLVQITKIQGA